MRTGAGAGAVAATAVVQPSYASPVASFTPDAPGTYVLGLVADVGCGRSAGNVTVVATCDASLSAVVTAQTVTLRSAPGLSAQQGAFGSFPALLLDPFASGSSYPPWAFRRWTVESAPAGSLAALAGYNRTDAGQAWAPGSYALAPTLTFDDGTAGPALLADVPGAYVLRVRRRLTMREGACLWLGVPSDDRSAPPFTLRPLQLTIADGCSAASAVLRVTATCA